MRAVLAGRRPGGRDAFDRAPSARRWTICLALIVVLHAAGIWAVLNLHASERLVPPPEPPLLVELPPLPAAKPVPHRVEPAPKHDVVKPPPPQPVVKPVVPQVPRIALAHVDVPLPPKTNARPVQQTAQTQMQARPLAQPPQTVTNAQPDQAPPAPAASAAPPATALPATAAPAAAGPSNAVITWQGAILARLERFKRYPISSQAKREQGVALIRFTMDRHGNVLTAAIQTSSGVDALDRETLALVHRAEPLPAPPPDVTTDPIELVVPVQFFLKR